MRTIFPLLVSALAMAGLAFAADGLMSVQVREGHVRQRAQFLSPVVTVLGYGDQVSAGQAGGDWTEVTTESGAAGWMHTTALTTKRIVLQATEADVQTAASGEELALAGKGFNKQVEEQFRTENANLDYSLVDKMERRAVREEDIRAFLAKGEVKGGSQ